ncbi:F-box and leucine-rich repeat protein 13 isoform X2 [Syngnathoides biaculeatus]|uniref:F-box and leucine-rich repeat protein 13 isoform X2 n=1 Tax=Syngnathoides biaculeatus TaxID=300417 RepID=UPI002ADD68DD|nr:F-box and leucine-rich repeat protein 13 isoform X2 [Syngnathoides biaculeatus]
MEGCDEEDPLEVPELPLEILVYILSFLQTSDRKEASLVCRSWYIASQDLCFQKNAVFCFTASASSLELVRSLGRRARCSLIISQLDGFSLSKSLLLEVGLCVGSKLDSLALPGSSVTEASLLALLPRLTSLRRLDLSGLDSLFMSGAFLSRKEHRQQVKSALSSLEELDLSDLRYLSDLTFNRLTSCTPRLRRLSLAGCHIAFEFDPYQGCPVGSVEVSSALLSLRILRKLLTEQRATFVALDLSRTAITPESLRSIAQVEGLSLEELCLQSCKELSDYSVEVLVKHQPGLQMLDISGCTELTSRAVVAVARGLSSLTQLSLSRDWKVTETGLAELVSVASLRGLDLSECLHVGGGEIVKGLSQRRAERAQLEKLNLRDCTYMRDEAIFSLTQLLGSSLRELDLTSCVNVTDLSVRAIATYLQGLRVLRLGRCIEVTDWGLLGMVETSTCELDEEKEDKGPRFTRTFGNMGFFKPPRLPFEDPPKLVTPDHLEQFKRHAGASLLALGRLRELDLSSCCKLTDASIAQVVRFTDLQRLSLSSLPNITDASLSAVAQHCRALTGLELGHCPCVSDRGVAQAAPHLHRLQHLSLSRCSNITDKSLFLLAQHCKRLKTLDVSRCSNISGTAVEHLQSQLPFLENFHFTLPGGTDFTHRFNVVGDVSSSEFADQY